MIRITQQREKCIGCNACVEAASYRWRISRKDGRCTLIGSTEKNGLASVVVGEDEFEDNKIAAKNCPVRIIKIEKTR
ncbi:MAG: ferredoxin [Bacteroidia bacterium]|nr:ferredoxin [Bacteroidota bacterium]MBK8585239.1 ferredoxin [Bacteroidota bacterium]MBP9790992.1 ferredoxin [Bacteroidia bacterium]MBP9922899.1 ferredoxin [Bacteroidia bacterium]HQW00580.1 ferredoxin [Bacteroidia bacterium]